MPNYQILSKTAYAARRWKPHDNYQFAATDTVAALVAQEMPRAAMHMPLAFILQNDQLVPVAVQGIQSGQNLFVTPDGRWIGGYIPAIYRSYPFAIANTPDGQQVLVFDEDSGLIVDNAAEGSEAFFEPSGQPSKPVQAVIDFISHIQRNREATQRICTQIQQQEQLIQPWPITLRHPDGDRPLTGLYRVDEAAMNNLPAEAFESLRQGGALPVLFCQLLSMQHFSLLTALAEAHQQAAEQRVATLPTTPSGDLDLEFLKDSATISFGGMQ